MRVNKSRRTDESLKGLADFLNTAHPKMTEREWRSFRKGIEKNEIGNYFYSFAGNYMGAGQTRKVERISLEEAKDIRAEIHRALAYLRTDKDWKWPYAALVGFLNKLKLVTQYQCLPQEIYGKPLPGQPILHSHGKRWVARFWPKATTTKELLYTILIAGLIYGTLDRLKVCPECGKYLVVKYRSRRFCPNSDCKDTFFNRQKLQDGTFKTARRKQRLLKAS